MPLKVCTYIQLVWSLIGIESIEDMRMPTHAIFGRQRLETSTRFIQCLSEYYEASKHLEVYTSTFLSFLIEVCLLRLS